MPSKSAHLIAFLTIFIVSAVSHRFVYVHARALVRRDFQRRHEAVVRWMAVLFVVMDLPFVYLFFNRWLAPGHDDLTRALLYPFSLWQALMMFWTAILLVRLFVRRTSKVGVSVVRAGISSVRLARERSDSGATSPLEAEIQR